jgi:hypothetical protein
MNPGHTPASGAMPVRLGLSGAVAGNHLNQVAFGEAPNAAREGACAPQK